MATCTWIFLRRRACRVISAASLVAVISGVLVPRASADQISSLRAQASALASRIETLGRQEDALAQQYDQAQLAVQGLQQKVADAAREVAAADAHAARTRALLRESAIRAYIDGGTNPLASATNAVANATDTLLKAEYINSLATNQTDAIDQYHLAALQDQAAKQNLQLQTRAARDQADVLAADRRSVVQAQSQLQGALAQDRGRIATLVAQQQAAEAARARREAAARLLARQEAAAAAAAAAAATAAAAAQHPAYSVSTSNPPPPVGSGAAGALAAAETRVGDPYVWGAAGPDAFDCSGLVMWAYAQVGVSLPHFSGAQYADTIHIPLSDVEPGDLVFPADPSEHVAMYAGAGEIIEAPYTGATVHIVPMGSWFVLASRVA